MTYSIEENHHSGLELYFMPRFFVYNPCRRLQDGEDVFFSVPWWYHLIRKSIHARKPHIS